MQDSWKAQHTFWINDMKYTGKIPVHTTKIELVEVEVELNPYHTEDQICEAGLKKLKKMFPPKPGLEDDWDLEGDWEWRTKDGLFVYVEIGEHMFEENDDI